MKAKQNEKSFFKPKEILTYFSEQALNMSNLIGYSKN